MNPSASGRSRSSKGFTLVEIVVVLFILGIVISMAAVLTRGVTAAQQRSTTATRLATIDAALVQFAQQQRRLPCPADGTRASSATGNPIPGDENPNRTAAGCPAAGGNYETNGIVPWRSLGLSETDVTDGWGRRITYRIDPTLAADGALDLTVCDAAGQELTRFSAATVARPCNTACTSTTLTSCTEPGVPLINKGLRVKNLAGTIVMEPAPATGVASTGAAYVLVSHGQTGGGAYLNTGVLSPGTGTDGTEEAKNYASASYVVGVTYYVDDTINDTSGAATHFDDMVLRPSVMNVISRAGLGPRTH
jgi:prepilin-type N-terminal cleavage/methylation domain-containing protein